MSDKPNPYDLSSRFKRVEDSAVTNSLSAYERLAADVECLKASLVVEIPDFADGSEADRIKWLEGKVRQLQGREQLVHELGAKYAEPKLRVRELEAACERRDRQLSLLTRERDEWKGRADGLYVLVKQFEARLTEAEGQRDRLKSATPQHWTKLLRDLDREQVEANARIAALESQVVRLKEACERIPALLDRAVANNESSCASWSALGFHGTECDCLQYRVDCNNAIRRLQAALREVEA